MSNTTVVCDHGWHAVQRVPQNWPRLQAVFEEAGCLVLRIPEVVSNDTGTPACYGEFR